MATLSDLENAIDVLLDHPLGIGQYQLVRRAEPKAYEAYVFGLCLRAARELNVTPVLRGITGPPTPFIFRGGPGRFTPHRAILDTQRLQSTGTNLKSTLVSSLREPVI